MGIKDEDEEERSNEDPGEPEERAQKMGVELLALDQLVTESDFLTVHLPKTPETLGLINRDLLLKAKPSLRVINVARGGIVHEQDLADCVRDGVIDDTEVVRVLGLPESDHSA